MMSRTIWTAVIVALVACVSTARAQQNQDLARKAQAILKANCYRCHGHEGANEGGFSYVLDRQRLLASRKVVPGEPAKSRLLKRVVRGDMPPEDEKPRPAAADVEVLRQWIAAGAPDFNETPIENKLISFNGLVARIRRDLEVAGAHDRHYYRYFTLTHLYNAGYGKDELQSYRVGLSKLINSLSWGRSVVKPTAIDAEGTILRIDLRDYKWNEKVWATVLEAYPYAVLPQTRSAAVCVAATGCPLPWVRGDWFVAAASRPPLYHDVLQLPKTDRELETMLHVDVAEDIRQERVARAGFNGSGVSRSNRMIERHDSAFGPYWKSYDFAGSSGHRNLFQFPLGPGGSNGFVQDGGEVIFTLPNGLQGYMLVNGKGERIDKGPTSIVSDAKQPDRAVVNGLSCMSCHVQGLIEKTDQVRPSVIKNTNAFDPKEAEQILALYPKRADFDKLLQGDKEHFARAVAAAGGRVNQDGKVIGSDPVVNLALLFDRELDRNLLAGEVGVRVEVLLHALDRSPALARALGPIKVEGGTVQRQEVVAVFADLVHVLKLGVFISSTRSIATAEAPAPVTTRPRATGKVTDPLLRQALKELQSGDFWARKGACERLAKVTEPPDDREPVAQALEPLVDDSNGFVRNAAIKALSVWGTSESVPALLKALKSGDIWTRQGAAEALGKLKDKRAVAPIAALLPDVQSRGAAVNALKSMGPIAETEVVKHLRSSDIWLKKAACEILKEIGTRQSIPALQRVLRDTSIHVRVHVAPTAREAILTILARTRKQ